MKLASDTALTQENEQKYIVVDYATTDAKINSESKFNGEAEKKPKSMYRTLSEWDQKTVGRRNVSKNLLTIPWWWHIGAAKRIFILIFYNFFSGAQFAFALAGNSMALSTDAVCRVAQIFSHIICVFPYVFPNSKHNYRNQVVASGVSSFVFLGIIIVFFVHASEEICSLHTGSVSPVPVIVFGSLGFFMSLVSVGCHNLYLEKLDRETRRQGSGTYVVIDSMRAIILIVCASLMFFLPDKESQIDSWSTIVMCVCMFWNVIIDLCHWKEFAAPFRGKKNRHDIGTMFHHFSSDERDINFQNAHQIPKPVVASSVLATAATSGDKLSLGVEEKKGSF